MFITNFPSNICMKQQVLKVSNTTVNTNNPLINATNFNLSVANKNTPINTNNLINTKYINSTKQSK